MKKLKLGKETIKTLSSATLSAAVGGAQPNPTAGELCANTAQICIDTATIPTNCPCQPTGGCHTGGCPAWSAGC